MNHAIGIGLPGYGWTGFLTNMLWRRFGRVCVWALAFCGPLILQVGGATHPGDDADRKTTAPGWAERIRCVVAVEFYIQREIDRQQIEVAGLVLDEEGLIIVHENAIPNWLPPAWFKDFKIHLPGQDGDGYAAEYLGQDFGSGWHYLRAENKARPELIPVTRFPRARPLAGQFLWGIGLQGKDFDYLPYLLRSLLSFSMRLPLETGFAQGEFAIPGGPVFDERGAFVGWALPSFPEDRTFYYSGDQANVAVVNSRESNGFLFADDFFAEAGRVPSKPVGEPRPWIGLAGLQPLPKETAQFLDLTGQGAVVISEIVEDSPAARAGLKAKDIIVGLDGVPLPKMRPDSAVQGWLERALQHKQPGQTTLFSLWRDQERLEVTIDTDTAPTNLREAERRYFERLGFSVREFILGDALVRRVKRSEMKGAVASFVRPNSPSSTGNLQSGDWIRQVDNREVNNFAELTEALTAAEQADDRSELVLLISRDNETKVLRIKLQ